MDVLNQILRLIFRIKYWLIFLPLTVALIFIYKTREMPREYEVSTTIYTGIASGFTIESGMDGGGRVDWSSVNNGMDNLISIIKSKTTLRNVSLRLYAQHMIYGDSLKDNNFITAEHYRSLLRITPREVKALIDTSSIDRTIRNLNNYEKASPRNFVYGLFNWNHHHYSYTALSKIEVRRIFNSDMLDIKYSSNDPGITFNTLVILNEEFVNQYQLLRFGETNNVVDYFRNELLELSKKLRASEDSLTDYSISKKIINYGEQTKQVAAMSRDYDLLFNEVLLRYTSAATSVRELEDKIENQVKVIENNTQFIGKINEISTLSSQLAKLQTFATDTVASRNAEIIETKRRLDVAEQDLKALSGEISSQKYTKEGIATTTFVDQWITNLIEREKAYAEMNVMTDVIRKLEDQYAFFSPIGSTLKRIERDISFTEQSYLSVLQSLNAALLRQKTLQMTSANLKPINPPLFPVSPLPTKRRLIVLTSYLISLVFLIAFFILVEIFDRTLRDRYRTERIIPAKVLGAFPRQHRFRFRSYYSTYVRICTNYLANSIIPFLNPKERPDIINFISTDDGTGKSKLINLLDEYWTDRGLKVRVINWSEQEFSESREYLLSNNFYDFNDYDNEDIIIIEHRSLMKSAIPVGLLREASLNLLVVRADKVWRDIDKIAFDRLKDQVQTTPLMLYLSETTRDVAESFVGQMPPVSKLRSFIYRLLQLGFTSK
ncbi:MAG: hypothetical protein BGO30_09865 [Bacteroidetes bacterium 41-46]|jgi:hypothetical protein|nr:MAG: hypothetical protein BGO30_09865 [Bacteroidetes bacterium 41-46]